MTENSVIRQKIIDSQFKCYERMNRAPPYKKKGKKGFLKNLYFSICGYITKKKYFLLYTNP